MSFKSFLILSAILAGVFSACTHREAHTEADAHRYDAYRAGFVRLVENEVAKNFAASKPIVQIEKIEEDGNELLIHYKMNYSENFSDGEKIVRETNGTAVLSKKIRIPESGGIYVLSEIRDTVNTMRFFKGTEVTATLAR